MHRLEAFGDGRQNRFRPGAFMPATLVSDSQIIVDQRCVVDRMV
jgi:hypothetical protein